MQMATVTQAEMINAVFEYRGAHGRADRTLT